MAGKRQGEKPVLRFDAGELSPLLDARMDIAQVDAAGRTVENMMVTNRGEAVRRPGLRFIAQARGAVAMDFVSRAGTATYYGITELANVSDPPRKYLQLVPGNGAMMVNRSSAPTEAGFGAYNRTVYDLTGTRTAQVQSWADDVTAAPIGSISGVGLNSPADSLESSQWSSLLSPWDGFAPVWTKSKTAKYFEFGDWAAISGQNGGAGLHCCLGVGRLGGLVGSVRGLGVVVAWNGAGWTLTLRPWQQDASNGRQVYARFAAGNQDPGTVSTSDTRVANTAAQFPTATLLLPPDTSVRFLVVQTSAPTSGDIQVPQQIGTVITNGDEAASGLTEDAFDRWLYLPATEGELTPARFEERLCAEDTLTAAIQRSSGFVEAAEQTASTTSLSGGVTAESNSPIVWTGVVVTASRTVSGLTVGHRYQIIATVRENTIGQVDYVDSEEIGDEFVAVATSQVVSFEVRARLGMDKRCLLLVADDLGAEEVLPDYDPDTILWWGKVVAAGGTVTTEMVELADALMVELKAQGLFAKCCYFLPLIGSDLTAALVPLIDRDAVGNAANTAFVAGDFTFAGGLVGNGSSKLLTVARTPGELGTGTRGGLGYWAIAAANTGTSGAGIGTANSGATQVFRLIPKGGSSETRFDWGALANNASSVQSVWTGFIYGQRSSATSRVVSRDDATLDSDTTNDSASDPNDADFKVLGDINISGTRYTAGTCGAAWFDDGTLTAGERTALYETLRDFLMTPSGRI